MMSRRNGDVEDGYDDVKDGYDVSQNDIINDGMIMTSSRKDDVTEGKSS